MDSISTSNLLVCVEPANAVHMVSQCHEKIVQLCSWQNCSISMDVQDIQSNVVAK